MTTVSEKLNYIPYRQVDTPFKIWFNNYKEHLEHLFDFFKDALYDVEPFTTKNLSSDKSLIKFSKMIYKNSSRVIK